MIFYLYAFKNRLIGQFDRPLAEIVSPQDYESNVSMALVAADPAALTRSKEFDVYCVGEMDVKSGLVTPRNDFVCSLEAICLRLLEHKKGEENVSSEKVD